MISPVVLIMLWLSDQIENRVHDSFAFSSLWVLGILDKAWFQVIVHYSIQRAEVEDSVCGLGRNWKMMETHEQFLRIAFVSLAGVKYLQSFYVCLWTWVFFKPKALICFDIAVYRFGRIYGSRLKHRRVFFSFLILSWPGNGANQRHNLLPPA